MLAEEGRPKEAARACEAARRVAPRFSIAKYASAARSDHTVYLSQREHVVAAMHKAGISDALG